ncbi:ABC transporter permease [Blautia schinkii]|nr:ABC transporter permease [Blautia schinkii]
MVVNKNQTTAGKQTGFALLKNGNVVMGLVTIAAFVVLSVIIPQFLTVGNIFNLLVQASSIGIPAIGLTFIIITAGIDLSLPTTMAVSAILGCAIMAKTQSTFLGVVSILAIAMFIGAINGISVSKLKMVPMIVTLAVSTVNIGISNYYTQGKSVSGLPKSFSSVFAGSIGGVLPISVLVFALVAVVMHILLTKTIFGRQLFQTGVNEKAARVNGVNTTKIIFLIYFIGGCMAGINGILTAARLNSAGPTMGPQSAFNNIVCACVLGGASVWGGKGTILGTVFGSIVMALITNVMNLMNIDFFVTYVIKGLVIIAVCYLDVLRNRVKGSR